MLLYAQLLKTKRHFVRKEISSYVKVDENNWHFCKQGIARLCWEKVGLMNPHSVAPQLVNNFCNLQSLFTTSPQKFKRGFKASNVCLLKHFVAMSATLKTGPTRLRKTELSSVFCCIQSILSARCFTFAQPVGARTKSVYWICWYVGSPPAR